MSNSLRTATVLLVDPDRATRDSLQAGLIEVGIGRVIPTTSLAGVEELTERGVVGDLALISLLTGHDAGRIIATLRAAGWARVLALAPTADIGPVIDAVGAGVNGVLIGRRANPAAANIPSSIHDLSSREIEVIRLVADGRSNKWIGDELNLSALTVKSHLARIGRKLGPGIVLTWSPWPCVPASFPDRPYRPEQSIHRRPEPILDTRRPHVRQTVAVHTPGGLADSASSDGRSQAASSVADGTPRPKPPITPLLVPRDGNVLPIVDPVRLADWARRLEPRFGTGGPGRRARIRLPIRVAGVPGAAAAAGRRDGAVRPDRARRSRRSGRTTGQLGMGAARRQPGPPCLADAGMRPRKLFDTELAGRLAGLPRVGLGPLVEQMLGLGLAKGHGAADWSTRPLPPAWLTYAALDVEVLIELRDAMEELLDSQGKLDWARQEFAAIVAAPPAPPRVDPWRRTSGIHKVRDPRVLAVVRELWTARDNMARRRDLAPHRVLPGHRDHGRRHREACVAGSPGRAARLHRPHPATSVVDLVGCHPPGHGPARRRASAVDICPATGRHRRRSGPSRIPRRQPG